jgi:hypothetical protein
MSSHRGLLCDKYFLSIDTKGIGAYGKNIRNEKSLLFCHNLVGFDLKHEGYKAYQRCEASFKQKKFISIISIYIRDTTWTFCGQIFLVEKKDK